MAPFALMLVERESPVVIGVMSTRRCADVRRFATEEETAACKNTESIALLRRSFHRGDDGDIPKYRFSPRRIRSAHTKHFLFAGQKNGKSNGIDAKIEISSFNQLIFVFFSFFVF